MTKFWTRTRTVARWIWKQARDTFSRSGPILFMVGAISLAFGLGRAADSSWWILIFPMLLGGAAIGAAEDRGEATAAISWAQRFWQLLETDHVLEVSVTHHNKPEENVEARTLQ